MPSLQREHVPIQRAILQPFNLDLLAPTPQTKREEVESIIKNLANHQKNVKSTIIATALSTFPPPPLPSTFSSDPRLSRHTHSITPIIDQKAIFDNLRKYSRPVKNAPNPAKFALKDAERGRNEPHKDYIPELGGIRKVRATRPGTGEFGPIEQAFIELAEYERHSKKVMQRWQGVREELVQREMMGIEEQQNTGVGDMGMAMQDDILDLGGEGKVDGDVEKQSPSKETAKVEEPAKPDEVEEVNHFKELEPPIPFTEIKRLEESKRDGNTDVDPLAEFEKLEGGSKEDSPAKAEPIPEDGETSEDPVQQQIAREMEMASSPAARSLTPQSTVAEAVPPPPLSRKRSRSRLDVAASRRFVYNSLGLKVPREDRKVEEGEKEPEKEPDKELSALELLAKQALGFAQGLKKSNGEGREKVIEDSASSAEAILSDMEIDRPSKDLQQTRNNDHIMEVDLVDKEPESAEEDNKLSGFMDIELFGSEADAPVENANRAASLEVQLIESDDDVPLLPKAGEVTHIGKWSSYKHKNSPRPGERANIRDTRRHNRNKSKELNPLPSDLDAELFGSPGPTQETQVVRDSPKPEERANIRDIWREQRKKHKKKNPLPSDLDAELFGSPVPTQESTPGPTQETNVDPQSPKSPKQNFGIFGQSHRYMNIIGRLAGNSGNNNTPIGQLAENSGRTRKGSAGPREATNGRKAEEKAMDDVMDLDTPFLAEEEDESKAKEKFAEVQNISSDDEVEQLPHIGDPIIIDDTKDSDWDMAEYEEEEEEIEIEEVEDEENVTKPGEEWKTGTISFQLSPTERVPVPPFAKMPVAPMARYDPVAQLEEEDSEDDGKYMMTAAGPSRIDVTRDPRLKR